MTGRTVTGRAGKQCKSGFGNSRVGREAARPVLVALVLAMTTTMAGCGNVGSLYDVPLPGGADLGEHPYRVTVEFADVLDLVPQAGVKVNDVPVGRVERIEVADDGWTAQVTLRVNGGVKLPANTTAQLRQSSLLGEKFVELAKPSEPPAPLDVGKQLADGDRVPLSRSDRNPEVEEVFGALSMLLNGGGVGQVQNIARELNAALSGNEEQLRSLLSNMDIFVGEMDAHRAEIVRALNGLDRLSRSLNERHDEIAGVLDDLGPGIAVLAEQRANLVTMLGSLDKLSGIAVDTVHRSKDDVVADLTALAPTLRSLSEAGADLPQAMEVLLTYPFTDEVLAGTKGDYMNTYLDLNLDPDTVRMLQEQAKAAQPEVAAPPLPDEPRANGRPAPGSGGPR